MPVSVVIGGQYGSEGKGKVAHWLTRERGAELAVRVGGPNSGHTVVDAEGRHVLRQIPTPAIETGVRVAIAAGSYVDPEVLLREVQQLRLGPDRLIIDPAAIVVSTPSRQAEIDAHLRQRIGSTESGTGDAVQSRVRRDGSAVFVGSVDALRPFTRPVVPILRAAVDNRLRVVVEGTQGFGLSVLHSPDYPFVTSRDTSAAGALSEVGLSPLDVDEVVLVIRAFPIRVGGNSGRLENETDWPTVTSRGGHDHPISEFTTVTGRLRRVAYFDADLVRRAIEVNNPTSIVLNHLDYLDHECCLERRPTEIVKRFVAEVQGELQREIKFLGLGPTEIVRSPATRFSTIQNLLREGAAEKFA
jgi:adenylosuccinate synthase